MAKDIYKDIGDIGLNTSGWGESGDEFLDEWRGATNKAKRVREMLYNSATVGALRLAVEMPLRDIEWQFVSEDGEDDPRLELLNESFASLSHSWNDHVIDALDFLWFGWSMFTITYQQRDGRILWRKFRPLGHDTLQRWLYDEDGGMAGIQQWPHLNPDPVPIERMVIYRFRRARGNPEGFSVLRPAWTSWYYAKNIQHVEAIGIERNLAGLPIVQLPEGADTTESDSDDTDAGRARQLAQGVRNDSRAGVVIPFGWDFRLAASGGTGANNTDAVISRYDKRILMSALAQFIMLGMDNIGALATYSGSQDFFTLTLNAVADTLAETFTKFAVERLLKLNGLDPHGVRLTHSPAGGLKPEQIAAALGQIGQGGFLTWSADDEVWLRSIFRLPVRDTETIQAARDEAQAARDAAVRQAMAQRPPTVDRQTAEIEPEAYAAADGDDAARQQWERQWQRKMAAFLARQQRDVTRQARREHGR